MSFEAPLPEDLQQVLDQLREAQPQDEQVRSAGLQPC